MATPGTSAAARRSHTIRFGLLTKPSPVILFTRSNANVPRHSRARALHYVNAQQPNLTGASRY
jgi:hypothetical protein